LGKSLLLAAAMLMILGDAAFFTVLMTPPPRHPGDIDDPTFIILDLGFFALMFAPAAALAGWHLVRPMKETVLRMALFAYFGAWLLILPPVVKYEDWLW
jgi:hypothetical protein